METKNMTAMIIAMAIGVVMIAGVMSPILASVIGGGSSSNEITLTNEGGRIDDISVITDRYDIHSELETVDEDTDDPYAAISTGTTRIQFVYENEELVWQFVEFTGPWIEHFPEYRVIQSETITESCVLAITQNTMVAYDHDKKEIQFAYESGSSPTYSVSSIADDNMDMYLMYDLLWDDEEDKEVLGLVFSFDSINGGYFEEHPTGRIYDPNGADTSIYGDTGEIYYDEGNLTFGCLSADGSNASYLISYINDNGEISQISYSGDTVTVGDTIHEEMMGCGYMDLSKGQGVELVITSSNEPYPAISNIYIVPHTVKGTPQEVRNEGAPMSKIEDLTRQGYTFKVQRATEGDTYFAWYIYDSNNELVRTASLPDGARGTSTVLTMSDKIMVNHSDVGYAPTNSTIAIRTAEGQNFILYESTDFVLTISADNGTPTLTVVASELAEPIEITGLTGFVTDSEGDWSLLLAPDMYDTGDALPIVKYRDIKDVYFAGGWPLVYAYQGGTASALAKIGWDANSTDPSTTVTFDSMAGVTDYGNYKQFTCVEYISTNDEGPEPSGVLLKIQDSLGEHIESAVMYIVPTVAYEPSSGGNGGASGTLATVISVIPLVMAVGLVIGAIGYIKMKN